MGTMTVAVRPVFSCAPCPPYLSRMPSLRPVIIARLCIGFGTSRLRAGRVSGTSAGITGPPMTLAKWWSRWTMARASFCPGVPSGRSPWRLASSRSTSYSAFRYASVARALRSSSVRQGPQTWPRRTWASCLVQADSPPQRSQVGVVQ